MRASFTSVQNESLMQKGFDQELIAQIACDKLTMQKLIEEAFQPGPVRDADLFRGQQALLLR
jgi:hypothetical protein